ncbi:MULTISPECIES: EAL domain-containing protein [Stenotrophomonas]|uniref:EAL domain-containing protein n=1 Tax=Stenotrophomonas TaxID=40323 RepID=UPI00081CCEA1|nr:MULTISPECIES: EAL domain-containing protein [Stenotrophomonas]AOA71056.1 signal peptide protein [Stenotrophomonas rhizophila]MDY0980329.1 EAL domain-containing protein [Stenotrophomonas sp. CFBP8994]UQY88173.1 EAL domain-containing protein [Stenotrophomonas rhizophila]
MKRASTIAAIALAALLGAILPVAALVYISWSRAQVAETDRLERTAERTLQRAHRAYEAGLLALRKLNQAQLPGCSPEHLKLMRSLTLSTTSAEQVGYFEEGRLRCTSWGMVEDLVPEPTPDHITADGASITLGVRPVAGDGAASLLSLQLGRHDILMDPSRFVDVIAEPNVRLAVATPDGRLIAQQPMADPELLQRLLREPHNGHTPRTLFASAQDQEWLAIAIAPRVGLVAAFQQQLWQLVPLGVVGAVLATVAGIWLSRRRLSLRNELASAVRRREFRMDYQPIIELDTGICVGAEALVRWSRADGTQVRPDLFIPVAEETGLIEALTDHVMDLVISDMRELLIHDRSAHIAINLSAGDVSSGRALKVLSGKLVGSGIHPQQIWLEATERGFLDIQGARTSLAAARRAGHCVAIDDFGVGYSSLQYLQQLPLDALKIDKSFIDSIGTHSVTSPVTSHIIDMAKTLGLFTVAEGIETSAQLAYLQSRQVEFGQGWLFSRPLPAPEFVAFHEQRRMQYGKAPEDMQNPNSITE